MKQDEKETELLLSLFHVGHEPLIFSLSATWSKEYKRQSIFVAQDSTSAKEDDGIPSGMTS
jgi:hypothetical protein